MKKFILFIVLFLPFSAFAKTEGFQAGVDGIYTWTKHNYTTDTGFFSRDQFTSSNSGFGVNFQYAFNIDKVLLAEPIIPVFIAPELFYEKISASSQDIYQEKFLVKNRYGLKLNLGLDITENFFIYATGGGGAVQYEIDWTNLNGSKKSGTGFNFLYGGGVGYHIGKNFIVRLEYNIEDVDLKTDSYYTGSAENGYVETAETTINMVKLGVAYQF